MSLEAKQPLTRSKTSPYNRDVCFFCDIEQASEVAANIEFVTVAEMALKSVKIMNMSQLQAAYDTISQENNVKAKTCSRNAIKKLIQVEIEDVEFHKPKRVNESERVSIKESRDIAIQLSETANEDCTSNMKTLYDAAVLESSEDLLNKQKKNGWGAFQDSRSSSQPHYSCLGTRRERCSTVDTHY